MAEGKNVDAPPAIYHPLNGFNVVCKSAKKNKLAIFHNVRKKTESSLVCALCVAEDKVGSTPMAYVDFVFI